MKNLILFLAITLVSTISINAQSTASTGRIFGKNQVDLNVGVGLVPTFSRKNVTSVGVPLTASIDYMIGNKFSLGASYGRSVSDSDQVIISDGIAAQYRNTFQEYALRVGFHYTELEKFDFYGGTTVAYTQSNIEKANGEFGEYETQKGIQAESSRVLPMAFLGTKYAVTPRIAAFGEITYGVSLAKVGVSVRLL